MNLNNYNIDAYINEWKNIIISESERYDYPTDDEMDDMHRQSEEYAKEAKSKIPTKLKELFADYNYICVGMTFDESYGLVIIDADVSFKNLNDRMSQKNSDTEADYKDFLDCVAIIDKNFDIIKMVKGDEKRITDFMKSSNLKEAMSIDDILNAHAEKKAADDKKAEEEKARREQETRIEKITVNDIKGKNIKYSIKYANGKVVEDEFNCENIDDKDWNKMVYKIRKMTEKTPNCAEVCLSFMRSAFNANSKTPIKWEYNVDVSEWDNDYYERRGRDAEDRYWSPSEDYFGFSPADIDAMLDSGVRIPGISW